MYTEEVQFDTANMEYAKNCSELVLKYPKRAIKSRLQRRNTTTALKEYQMNARVKGAPSAGSWFSARFPTTSWIVHWTKLALNVLAHCLFLQFQPFFGISLNLTSKVRRPLLKPFGIPAKWLAVLAVQFSNGRSTPRFFRANKTARDDVGNCQFHSLFSISIYHSDRGFEWK